MKSIKGLVLKDLLNLSNYKLTLLMTLVIFIGISISQNSFSSFLPTVIIMMIGMIALSTFSYDEIAKSDKFLLSLPTDRKEIVKAKYFLVIGLTLIGAAFAFVINFCITYFMFKQAPDLSASLIPIFSGLFGIGIIESIQIPSIYKWGAEKGRIQMFVIFILIAALIGVVVYFASKNININIDIDTLKNGLKKFLAPILVLLNILIYFISYKVSNKIYSKKEI